MTDITKEKPAIRCGFFFFINFFQFFFVVETLIKQGKHKIINFFSLNNHFFYCKVLFIRNKKVYLKTQTGKPIKQTR